MAIINGINDDLIKKADELADKAFLAERYADTHHYFLCAADLYSEAGCEDSARWASQKADQCMRVMSRWTRYGS